MSLKKLLAAGLVATTLSTAAVPAASAASSDPSSGPTAPEGWEPDKTNPDFEQGEAGSTGTGSSPLDTGLVISASVLGSLALLKLITDNVPALRAQVDQLAAQLGLQDVSGSSEANRLYGGGLDFDLERLARTNGFPEIADQLAALKAGSSAPAPAQ
ncbi:hypothetical protein [Corynebacterium sp.]|uniref:hypothetical protein n=1 Tax=Corynebacterium sp. TaxID=1720 RepID=UPI0026DC2BA2|nr:hypothetical protein [Corynebacterium sp.]MDO5032183.1 hypothetical protein [Corynebacterium sp.]